MGTAGDAWSEARHSDTDADKANGHSIDGSGCSSCSAADRPVDANRSSWGAAFVRKRRVRSEMPARIPQLSVTLGRRISEKQVPWGGFEGLKGRDMEIYEDP